MNTTSTALMCGMCGCENEFIPVCFACGTSLEGARPAEVKEVLTLTATDDYTTPEVKIYAADPCDRLADLKLEDVLVIGVDDRARRRSWGDKPAKKVEKKVKEDKPLLKWRNNPVRCAWETSCGRGIVLHKTARDFPTGLRTTWCAVRESGSLRGFKTLGEAKAWCESCL